MKTIKTVIEIEDIVSSNNPTRCVALKDVSSDSNNAPTRRFGLSTIHGLKQLKWLFLTSMLAVSSVSYAAPQTLSMIGSDLPAGDIDPYSQGSTSENGPWGPTYAVGDHPWQTLGTGGEISGATGWVNIYPTQSCPADEICGLNDTSWVRIRFHMPLTFSNASMNIQMKADNKATVYLNSGFLAEVTATEVTAGNLNPTSINLQPGLNEIKFKLEDWGGLVAYQYRIDLNFESDDAATLVAVGPRGPKGDTGDTGATGAQGPEGELGPTGTPGSNGATGPQGPKGDNGSNGATGSQGPKGDNGSNGATGSQGPKGDNGSNGATGSQGDTGATGPQGSKGDTGATGAVGPQGFIGSQGFTGPQGSEGLQGPQGLQGETGAIGPQGATGPQGEGLFSGSLLLLLEGTEPPAGYTRLGSYNYKLKLNNGKNKKHGHKDHDDHGDKKSKSKRDHSDHNHKKYKKITVVVYQRN